MGQWGRPVDGAGEGLNVREDSVLWRCGAGPTRQGSEADAWVPRARAGVWSGVDGRGEEKNGLGRDALLLLSGAAAGASRLFRFLLGFACAFRRVQQSSLIPLAIGISLAEAKHD